MEVFKLIYISSKKIGFIIFTNNNKVKLKFKNYYNILDVDKGSK